MDKKEYLQTVIEQIRCQKARDAVKDELENHIEDQKEALMMEGMKEEEAAMRAVEDMGDPVETGVTLDLVHRPKMQWKMVVFVIGLSILGLILQYVIRTGIASEIYSYKYSNQVVHIIAGIMIMFAFCFLDYSRIGLYGKMGAVCLLLISLSTKFFGYTINGQSGQMRIFVNFSMHQLIYLYIPFFGGILYSYKGQGRKAFYKSIAWMMAPVLATLTYPNSLVAICLLVIMSIQLTVVIKKGWIQTSKKVLKAVIGAVIVLPTAYILYFLFISKQPEYSYLMQTTRDVLMESTWVGQCTGETIKTLPLIECNFILTYVSSHYGIAIAVVLSALLGLFVFWIIKISIGQKNQLGMIMGIGCSLVFGIQIIVYLLVNVSLLPITTAFLPLFTYGGTGTFVSFALIGILLSIYRYQNVLPVSPYKKRITIEV